MLKEGHSYLFITNKGEPLYPKMAYNFVRNKPNLYTDRAQKALIFSGTVLLLNLPDAELISMQSRRYFDASLASWHKCTCTIR